MKELNASPLLEVNDLAIGYPETETILFKNLNLHLQPGRLVCFMGPNGIGKSTLIKTLLGLQKKIAGEIIIKENDSTTDESISKQIAVVLTDRIAVGNMSVFELVSFGRYPYLTWNIKLSRKDEEIVKNAIAQVHIQPLAHKKLHELSDGQHQMVMIARALAQDTRIIILDEPTAHLDLNNRVQIMKMLRNLTRSTNKSILIATHDLDLALQTADHIWLTGDNQNIITGLPEDLVLNGSFDKIFNFKGYDLKTGKVQHDIFQKAGVQLTGTGYSFLWTKNALERNGFEVLQKTGSHNVTIQTTDTYFTWVVDNHHSFNSVQELISFLQSV